MKKVSTFVGSVLVACVAIFVGGLAYGQIAAENAPAKAEPTEAAVPEKPATSVVALEAANKEREACKCVGEADSESVQKIKQALRAPLHSNGLEFSEQPLADVVNQLQEEYQIPIKLDKPALDAIGIRADEPATISVNNVSLKAALRLMLKSLQLTYVIQDEVLIITTPDEADKMLVTCVYDVRDLAAANKQPEPKGASARADYNPLIGAITECIAKDTWHENGGGDAAIRPLQPGLLVISQTAAVHEEICELLAAIRTVNDNSEAAKHPGF
jgi:hypothetical protein